MSPPATTNNNTSALGQLCFWRYIPFAGYLILLTELCERFAYYGMTAILPLFMTSHLKLSQGGAVAAMSFLSFSSYLFAFIGAVVSDSFIGRFATITLFSCIYAVGMVVLSLSAVPKLTALWMTLLALGTIALGTGGIKPCVSSFGGDQIASAESRSRFFAYFYLMVNVGSFASMFLVPLIKSKPCLGQTECYVGAFALPTALMVLAIIFFSAGYRLYKPGPPKNRIMLNFFGAIGSAIKNKVVLLARRTPHESPESWLAYASDKYSPQLLKDCQAMLRVLRTFLPLCLFWGLYSQMSSRWIFQAALMVGKVGKITVMPEQMGMVNCVLVLILVPLFDGLVYPLLGKIFRRKVTPFGQIVAAMILASFSFFVAAGLQLAMDNRGTFRPDPLNPDSLQCITGCMSMAWQVPQYLLLTIAEVMLCTANLAMVYAMAPRELKSLCAAVSMLTNAAGNLLVMLMAKVDPVRWITKTHGAVGNYIMWAGLCLVGLVWFLFATRGMKFEKDVDHEQPEVVIVDSAEQVMEEKTAVLDEKTVV